MENFTELLIFKQHTSTWWEILFKEHWLKWCGSVDLGKNLKIVPILMVQDLISLIQKTILF